jgi:hypothetical protein
VADLFRYIEQQFAVPAPADAIELVNDSQRQTRLQEAAAGEAAGAAVREVASAFPGLRGPSGSRVNGSAQGETQSGG